MIGNAKRKPMWEELAQADEPFELDSDLLQWNQATLQAEKEKIRQDPFAAMRKVLENKKR